MSVEPPDDAIEADRSIDKRTLFCVSCPYHGPIGGRWAVVETDDSVHHLCPNCGTELPTRRRLGETAVVSERPLLGGTER
jgi:predicted RNA-binding Zn-ribbon protein involved in translation (DUF1610 family)